MSLRLIKVSEIATSKEKAGLLPVSQATVWRWVSEGKFPKPFKLGKRITVWNAAEVERFVAEQSAEVAQ